MGKKSSGFQQKIIIALLGVGLLSGATALLFSYVSRTKALEDTIGANFERLALDTAQKVDIIIDRKIRDTKSLAASPTFINQIKKIRTSPTSTRPKDNSELLSYIKRYQREREGDIFSVTLTDEKDNIIAATEKTQPHYQSKKSLLERLFTSDIDFDIATKTFSMMISAPITDDKSGEIIGGLRELHNLKEVFGIIDKVRIGKTGHADLVASDGTLVVCPIFPGQTHKISENLLRELSISEPGWKIAVDEAEGRRDSIIGFSPVKTTFELGEDNFLGKNLYVLIRQFPEDAYSPTYNLLWHLLIIAPTGIGILLMLSYFVSQWIVKPIKELSDSAELIGYGQPDPDIKIRTGDEIERLADTFNKMAKDLENRFEDIKLERDKLNTIMDSMGDGLVILDKDLRIQHLNAKFMDLYGKESVGKSCRDVFGIKDAPCNGCTAGDGEDVKPHTFEAVTNNGITYLITHSRIKNKDGTTSIIEIFKDITERKRLEQQLLQSERLAALSQFSSTFAHDLKNPVIAIKKTIEMLRDSSNFSGSETLNNVYTDLISTCGLLLGLVNDVLDIHQVSYKDLPMIYSHFSLKQALDEVVKLLKIEAEEKRLHIEIEGNKEEVRVEADKRRIQRVFINLLTNAIRYSPPSGKIKISFQNSSYDPEYPSRTSTLLFSIEDEGPGIIQSDLSKVFDLFYRKDIGEIKSGTGLGLYFCKVVIDAHKGRIWADNKKNGGAVFNFEIPISGRDANDYKDFNSRRPETFSAEPEISS